MTNTDRPLTAQYVRNVAKALDFLTNRAAVRWVDAADREHTAVLRGWRTDDEDIRDRLVWITRPMTEDAIPFSDIVDLVADHRIALA